MILPNDFSFKPIEIDKDGDTAVRFQVDAYNISFGDSQGFFDKFGNNGEGYLHWLKGLEKFDPYSAVHLWNDGEIVGQIELGTFKEDTSMGYVYLYYLSPDARGKGIGKLLDKYATSYFRSHGLRRVRLSVTTKNESALKFYKQLNWRLIGEDSQRPGVLVMEKSID